MNPLTLTETFLLGMLWTALDDDAGDGEEMFGNEDCCLLFDSVGDGCAPVPGVNGLAFGLKAIGRQASRRPGLELIA